MNKNKSAGKAKKILSLCFALLLFNTITYSQLFDNNYDNSSSYYEKNNTDDNYNTEDNHIESFSSLVYFKDTAGKSNIHFKQVTITRFSASDSLLTGKHPVGKITVFFNSSNWATHVAQYDSLGKCTDSVSFTYDKNNKAKEEIEYHRNDSGMIEKVKDEIITRNDKGQLIEDSLWKKSVSQGDDNNSKGTGSSSVIFEGYDDKGNCTSYLNVDNGDTDTYALMQFDNKNRRIMTKSYANHAWVYTSKKYDDSSNVIEENIGEDTEHDVWTYDNKNRELTYEKYMSGKLTRKITFVYNADGSYVKHGEEYNEPSGNATCDLREIKTVMADRYGNYISEITKTVEAGDTSTKYDTHKYTYTPKGKIISDTEIIREKGKFHNSKSMVTRNNKYDAHENLLEKAGRGSEQQAENNKITYVYNGKDKVLHVTIYSSCDDATPYGTEECIYYPDDTTIKEEKERIGAVGHSDLLYGKDSRVLSATVIYEGRVMQTMAEYEE